MVPKFDILSVDEDDGHIERLTGKINVGNGNLFLSINGESGVYIRVIYNNNVPGRIREAEIKLEKISINNLISFLEEAKQFVDEQEVMNRLIGK